MPEFLSVQDDPGATQSNLQAKVDDNASEVGQNEVRGILPLHLYQRRPTCQQIHVFAAQPPFEILRTIFLLATPLSELKTKPTFQHKYFMQPAQNKVPLSLTYVCRRWRSVALSIPELWNSVSVRWDWDDPITHNVFEIWLQNAESTLDTRRRQASEDDRPQDMSLYALNIHFSAINPNNFNPHQAQFNIRTSRSIANNIKSCRSLNLHLKIDILRQFLETCGKDGAAAALLLEDVEISIVFRSSGYVHEMLALRAWICALPVLRRIRLTYPPNTRNPVRSDGLPSSRLESLNTIILTVHSDFAYTLQQLSYCTSATRIEFMDMAWISTKWPSVIEHPATLPKLISLSLSGVGNALYLLNYLTLPALKHLSFTSRGHPGPGYAADTQPPAFGDFLIRSGCAIDNLSIFDPRMNQYEAINFLRTPGVTDIPAVDVSYQSFPLDDSVSDAYSRLLSAGFFDRLVVWQTEKDTSVGYHTGWGIEIRPCDIIAELCNSQRVDRRPGMLL